MILSVHIPKTAGVTLRNLLKDHFGPGFVLAYWEITDAWGRVHADVPPGTECIHGHYQADRFARRYPDARLMTWVRDPVERVASSYYHRLREPDWRHPVCTELHAKRLSLVEYAALPLVRNEMSRFFGSKRPRDFWFIGSVERFPESLARLAELLGLGSFAVRCDNANPDRQGCRYEIAACDRRVIAALNSDDMSLYESCRPLIEGHVCRDALPGHTCGRRSEKNLDLSAAPAG